MSFSWWRISVVPPPPNAIASIMTGAQPTGWDYWKTLTMLIGSVGWEGVQQCGLWSTLYIVFRINCCPSLCNAMQYVWGPIKRYWLSTVHYSWQKSLLDLSYFSDLSSYVHKTKSVRCLCDCDKGLQRRSHHCTSSWIGSFKCYLNYLLKL